MKAVLPKVFLTGFVDVDMTAITDYLIYTGQSNFLVDWQSARKDGVSDAECMLSMFAKMCYKSLVVGKNDNVSKVRDIPSNLQNVLKTAHLSILEHVNLNFVVTDCSRVFTHEQIRHRAGVAYSQTSGRYVAEGELRIVLDPILKPIEPNILRFLDLVESEGQTARRLMGLEGSKGFKEIYGKGVPDDFILEAAQRCLGVEKLEDLDSLSFDYKKKVTSALRRVYAPSGIANELAMTLNLRTLRHVIQLRTDPSAEWEIRYIYAQIFELASKKVPSAFSDATVSVVDGLPTISGMKMQPYET